MMHPLPVLYSIFTLLFQLQTNPPVQNIAPEKGVLSTSLSACNCNIIQGGSSYPINALVGTETAVDFYSYGIPSGSSANTGLELANTMVLFLYEDSNTGIISMFIINDIVNDGSGGTSMCEVNCLPDEAFVSVADDPGEMTGAPPLIVGNWSWSDCCTDGGVVENVGCTNTFNVDLLASSGIDSIIWLTGDIADPEHILLPMSGEAIIIDCGGGICCPVGFDTEILITNTSCPNTSDGAIELHPQDGMPAYDYVWSNGESTNTINDLLPGTYSVTITDSQGCMDELTIEVEATNAPEADPASLSLCSTLTEDGFDLTSVNEIVNMGTGLDVLWFENIDMSGPINNPSNYVTGSTTVYAFVDNGACLSEPVAVPLELLPQPIGIPASITLCEESNGMATFDLTSVDAVVSGGNGSISWYTDQNLSNPIADPTEFLSGPTTVYAIVNDGTCLSDPTEVQLMVDPKPDANSAQTSLCGNEFDDATFDLTLLDLEISGGNGVVEWYMDQELVLPINDPTQFVTGTTTVYAVVFDGTCYSDVVPVFLVVNHTPDGNPLTAEMCDDGTSMAMFDLTSYETAISMGQGLVEWYSDDMLIDWIAFPESYYTVSTIVYAVINDGVCFSNPIPVTLNVIESPVGNPTFLETCADGNGQGTFDLTAADDDVSGGIGEVFWFEDAQGNVSIENDTAYVTSGTTVYAQVSNGVCISASVPVNLLIVDSVSATSTDYPLCDDGSGIAVFDLTSVDNQVSNGSGQVNWFLDIAGTMVIVNPDSFPSSDSIVYASVTAGACTSDIVPVNLITLSSVQGNPASIDTCGDANGEATINLTSLDGVVSGGNGTVLWFGDPALTIPVNNPGGFVTGDTILYAVVSNGNCTSDPVYIGITVSAGLTANAASTELCIESGDTLNFNLTQMDAAISGGAGQVNWFVDPQGMTAIVSPSSYPVSSNDTLYANVSSGACASPVVQITISVVAIPVANSISLQRCGDANGEITIDLTTVESSVSDNTGIVTWFADPGLSMMILNTGAFVSGDTIIYALVTNGSCVSSPVPVSLNVVDSLIANSVTIEACVVGGGNAMLDLTQSDFDISGGGGVVSWFSDALGMNPIPNTTSYMSGDATVYASVAADGCISNIVPVTIDVFNSAIPVLDCAFSSIDSVGVSWNAITGNYEVSYTVNGVPAGGPVITSTTQFGVGGLAEGVMVEITVTALFNDPCGPLSSSITCETNTCPPQAVELVGLQDSYCSDEPAFIIVATPPGGQLSGVGVSGNTFNPSAVAGASTTITYVWQDVATGCAYDVSETIEIFNPLVAPVLDCKSNTLSSITFGWNTAPGQYGYAYSVNQGPLTNVFTTTADSLRIGNLAEGDEVTLMLWAVGPAPCGNSDTVSVSCLTYQCPNVTVSITDPGPFCSEDDPVQLEADVSSLPGGAVLTWSGPGVTSNGIFDPTLTGAGDYDVVLMVNSGGCLYSSSVELVVFLQPDPTFEVSGVPCLDSALNVSFNGAAFSNSEWNWELDGAEITSGSLPLDFSVQWPTAGDYSLSLQINWNICSSETFSVPIQIDAPLDTPVITCLEEDFYSIVVGWDEVAGASTYDVTSSIGNGTVSGTTFTLRQLPDDTTVLITVTAKGGSACGDATGIITCRTMKYIPVITFVPTVFSPNGDQLNDILYIQGNSQVLSVKSFRIFDRWGGVVFEKFGTPINDQSQGWDGAYAGKELNPGVFVYYIIVETNQGEEVIVGDVTLVR